MAIKSSGNIETPEMATLKIWEAMTTTLKTHQYIQENPKAIGDTIAKITNAYKLTEEEKNIRDAAVKAHDEAVKALAETKVQHESLLRDMVEAARKHEIDLASSTASAQKSLDAAKSMQEVKIKAANDDLIARSNIVDAKEKSISARETATADLKAKQDAFAKEVSAHESEKKQWESEKQDWEIEYNARLEKLSQRERKLIKS